MSLDLHDAVPIVTRGNAKQGEKRHAEVFEMGVFVQAGTRQFLRTFQFAE